MEQNNVKINGCVENDGNEEEGLSSEDKSKREKVSFLVYLLFSRDFQPEYSSFISLFTSNREASNGGIITEILSVNTFNFRLCIMGFTNYHGLYFVPLIGATSELHFLLYDPPSIAPRLHSVHKSAKTFSMHLANQCSIYSKYWHISWVECTWNAL